MQFKEILVEKYLRVDR